MKKLLTILSGSLYLVPNQVFAQGNQITVTDVGQFNGLTGITITSLISGGLKLILVAAAVIFFFMLVIGGIQWIMSGGDKAHTEAARGRITAALVGLVVVFAAWAITALIKTFFNIDIFTLNIPTLTNS